MSGFVVSVWDLIDDPDTPPATVQRFFARRRAAQRGGPVPAVQDEDLPHLVRNAQPNPNTIPETENR